MSFRLRPSISRHSGRHREATAADYTNLRRSHPRRVQPTGIFPGVPDRTLSWHPSPVLHELPCKYATCRPFYWDNPYAPVGCYLISIVTRTQGSSAPAPPMRTLLLLPLATSYKCPAVKCWPCTNSRNLPQDGHRLHWLHSAQALGMSC